jgi:hypothetical protein
MRTTINTALVLTALGLFLAGGPVDRGTAQRRHAVFGLGIHRCVGSAALAELGAIRPCFRPTHRAAPWRFSERAYQTFP